ncbi:T9SS type A sorting domain-containing protein [candidate division WOR-3 bacterium]|nr:T9SS type A sorting domain-containing protein [candidate division WOR-3 bacterium]
MKNKCITGLLILFSFFNQLISEKYFVNYQVPEMEISDFFVSGRVYSFIKPGPGLSCFAETGAPQLPSKSFIFIVPPRGSYSFDVSFSGGRTRQLVNPVLPVPQWKEENLVYEPDNKYYTKAYPGYSYIESEPFKIGYWRLVRIETYPVTYADGRITFAENIKIEATFSDNTSSVVPSESWLRIISFMAENYTHASIFAEGNTERIRTFSDQPYYRISLIEEGLYEVSGSDLENAGVNLDAIDPVTLSVFCGEAKALSWYLADTIHDSFQYEIPIIVQDGGDNKFDAGDRIIFYASSLKGYDKNNFPYSVTSYHSPWSDTVVYWLTWGGENGRRLVNQNSLPMTGSFIQTSFLDTVHVETDSLSPSQSGLRFIHREISRNPGDEVAGFSISYNVQSPAGQAQMNLHVFSGSTDSVNMHRMRVRLNGSQIGTAEWADEHSISPRIISFPCTGVLREGTNNQEVQLYRVYQNSSDFIMYDLTDVIYQRKYQTHEGMLVFGVNAGAGDTVLGFNVKGVSSGGLYVWNIDDPYNPTGIVNYTVSGDTVKFAWPGDSNSGFIVSNSLMKPVNIRYADPFALKRITGADYIIITPHQFLNAAEKLASYRRSHFPGGINPQVLVVELQEVYDNFGHGMSDPTAIRNYLKWASENYDPIPGYVLFMGCGTYDYRNIERRTPFRGAFPAHEEGGVVKYFSMQNFNSCFDDWYVDFDGNRYPDMCVGRITALTNVDINQNVEKIIRYENSSSFGSWKSRVLFLADDEYASRVDQSYNEYIHNYQTESISRFLSQDYQPVKVYLMNYLGTTQTAGPPYNYSPGEKPLAAQDLRQELNKGCFMLLFMGHGNLTVLTHEAVFRNPSDVDALENEIRQPICYFGSCGVGAFDRTTYSSMADGIQIKPDKGAIFTWGASRATFPSDNYPLAVNLMLSVLGDHLSTGEVTLVVKNTVHANSWHYLSFGDPALIPFKDTIGISMDLGRDKMLASGLSDISSTTGNGTLTSVSSPVLTSLSLAPVDTVDGRVTYTLTGTIDDPSFGDGWASVIVIPPQRPDSHDYMHRAIPLPNDFTYYFSDQFIPGLPVYEVLTTVDGNSFTATFTTPSKMLRSGDQSDMRRFMIYAYAWNSAKEARGHLELPCSGTDEQPSGDSAAPKVYVLVKGRILSDSGDIVQNPLEMEIVFEDQSGINLTPLPENVLFLRIDNGSLDTLAGRFFKYDVSSSVRGRIKKTFDFGNESGEHELTVAVSDNMGNRGVFAWSFNVESSSAPDITNVMNFPNPMENSTNFTFILTSGYADVTIEIYTVTGKLIEVIEAGEVTSGFNSVYWNGLDSEGDRPANGIYLYRINAVTRSTETAGSEREVSRVGKIFIVR